MNGLLIGIAWIGTLLTLSEIHYWVGHDGSDLPLLLAFILFSIVVIVVALIQDRTKKD